MAPSRVEVVEWMRRHGGSAKAASENFYPHASLEEQRKHAGRYRTWWSRTQARAIPGTAPVPSPPREAPSRAQRPQGRQAEADLDDTDADASVDLAAMSTVERLSWQLARMERLHADATRKRAHRSVSACDARIAALGQALDEARHSEGRVTKLDRTPAAVALEMKRRQKALDILAGAAEALQAGTAQAAENEPEQAP